jgi:hypothetical protein
LNASEQTLDVPLEAAEDPRRLALASRDGVRLEGAHVVMPPWSAAALDGGVAHERHARARQSGSKV